MLKITKKQEKLLQVLKESNELIDILQVHVQNKYIADFKFLNKNKISTEDLMRLLTNQYEVTVDELPEFFKFKASGHLYFARKQFDNYIVMWKTGDGEVDGYLYENEKCLEYVISKNWEIVD